MSELAELFLNPDQTLERTELRRFDPVHNLIRISKMLGPTQNPNRSKIVYFFILEIIWFRYRLVSNCRIKCQKSGDSVCCEIRQKNWILPQTFHRCSSVTDGLAKLWTFDLETRDRSLSKPHDPWPTGVGGPWNSKSFNLPYPNTYLEVTLVLIWSWLSCDTIVNRPKYNNTENRTLIFIKSYDRILSVEDSIVSAL